MTHATRFVAVAVLAALVLLNVSCSANGPQLCVASPVGHDKLEVGLPIPRSNPLHQPPVLEVEVQVLIQRSRPKVGIT